MCGCRAITATLALASVMCLAATVRGQCETNEVRKLLASDGATNDQFGVPVSISGDVAVIGASGDDDNGTNAGSAYVYGFDGAEWIEYKLTASDAAAGDGFGSGVSIGGDVAVIGAYLDDDNGSDSGSAYVFRVDPDSGQWVEEAKLLASDAAPADWFGQSVCLSGRVAVITAPWDDQKAGSAYVFRYDPDAEQWAEQAKLVASDRDPGDHLGSYCSISGEVIVVGAYTDDDAGTDSGSAYVFVEPTEGWSSVTSPILETAKLLPSDGAAGDHFGLSVGVSGNVAVVGARHNNGTGSAYLFCFDGLGWSQCAKLVASDGQGGDTFGRSVSISGQMVVIGAFWDDDAGTDSGSAYVFVEPGDGWSSGPSLIAEDAKLTASDAAAGDNFGISVSVSEDMAVIGVYKDDDNGTNSGSAYVFSVTCSAAPVCHADGPYQVECEGTTTNVPLNGTGSSDADGDPLTFLWTTDCPGGSFSNETSDMPILTADTAPGCDVNCNVTLTVDDGNGGTDSCSTTVTISASPTIPTVSEWGVVAMTLLLMTAITIVFARRAKPSLGCGH